MRLHAILAALILFLLSPAVWALSLGEAEAQSHLNQPLKATITVRAVNNDERDTIRAIIPNAEKFKRAGVRRDAIVDRIQVDVTDGKAEDELLIHLRTDERIQEPFLNFLVEVRWLGGSVIREYTLLLDPASVAESRRESGSQDVDTQPLGQPGAGAAEDEPPVYQPEESARRSASSGGRTYGPVQRHETLWSIAYDQRTDPGITMDQMQLAIYQANPQAFDGNINRLQTGSMLQIPPSHEIRAIDPDYAKREVARQKRSYSPPPAAPPPAPVMAEPEPLPEPEPVEEFSEPEESIEEPVTEPEEEPVAEAEPEMPATQEAEAPAGSAAGEKPPEQAAAPPTADSQPLTQDELMAEGDEDFGQLAEEDIEMPSLWAEEEGGEKPAQEGAPASGDTSAEPATAEVKPEPVVNEPPQETGISLPAGLNPVTLGLALVLLVVLLGTYWWYRRRNRAVNVGAQFAYAGAEEAEDEEQPEEKASQEARESGGKPSTRVWQDTDAVPDSIDEYTARSGPEEGGTGLEESAVQTVEVEPEDSSPIREMSSEEIDYLGEADVHLAYGLYDEAASVLQRGINENPNRDDLRLKLLEVYHSADQADEFVSAAEDWQKTGVEDEKAWQKAVQLGSKIAPGAALFQQAGATAESETPQPAEKTPTPPAAEEKTTAQAGGSEAEELDFDLSGFDMTEPDQAGEEAAQTPEDAAEPEAAEEETPEREKTEASEQAAVTAEESEIETVEPAPEEAETLDFEGFDMPAADESETADEEPAAETAEADKTTGDEEGLDFDIGDLSLDEEEQSPADEGATESLSDEGDEEESDQALDEAFASLGGEESVDETAEAGLAAEEEADSGELELGDLETAEPEEGEAEPTPAAAPDEKIADQPALDQEGDEEVSGKLDLARAYLDMGEPEMARTLLDEVVEMGNEQQRQEAQDLLTRAG